jgi:FSR family fosmidomycin resistance protein-like MFS transporter
MAPLTVGHAAVDFTQGVIPALLPALVARFSLSYTAAGGLVLAVTAASSVTQPLFGRLADRREALWLLPLGVVLSGTGLGLAAIAPTYALVFIAVLVAGLGVAAYHPEASRVARSLAHARPGSGLSVFSVGGNAGVAAGPAAAGVVLAVGGLDLAVVLGLPAVLCAAWLWRLLPRLRADDRHAASARASDSRVDRPRALVALLVGVALRAYVYFGLLSFVPLYEERVRDRSDGYGALLLSALLFAGAVGTLTMGRLADRRSPRRLMAGAMLAAGPLVALYVADPGPLGAVAAVLAGAVVIATFGLSLQLAQDFLPSSAAQAAGLSIGLSVGLGGVASLLIGLLADRVGLGASLASCAGVALLAGIVTARLPDGRPAPARLSRAVGG